MHPKKSAHTLLCSFKSFNYSSIIKTHPSGYNYKETKTRLSFIHAGVSTVVLTCLIHLNKIML